MGELEEAETSESYIPEEKRNSKMIAVIMLLLGLFAPIMIQIFGYGWTTPQVSIQSLFWMYYPELYYPSSYYGFTILPPIALFSMFPLILLRMVPVSQIYRYYNGKTTRKRAMIASFVGDGLFLIMTIPYLFLSFMGVFMAPLPFQLIFGLLVLWRYPIPEPTTPWKSEAGPKLWWETSSDSQQKKPSDEDNDLW